MVGPNTIAGAVVIVGVGVSILAGAGTSALIPPKEVEQETYSAHRSLAVIPKCQAENDTKCWAWRP